MTTTKYTIYKLINKNTNELLYVGMTKHFERRMAVHKCRLENKNNHASRYYHYEIYKQLRNNQITFNDLIIENEEYECENLNDALKIEEEITLENKPLYNTRCGNKNKY